jgi:TetR/AcrR family transcriptional regulator, mexCD-oprJ operon repressor
MGTADQIASEEGPFGGSDDLRADARRNIRSILEAAARVLAEDPAASVQEIADAAEVSRPTVYRHFSNREELIDAIGLEAMTQAREALDAAAASSEPAADALERLILDLADIVASYPLLATLIGTKQKPKDHGPPEGFLAAFDSLVARGRRDGTLRPDLRGEILGPVTVGALVMSLKVAGLQGLDPHDVGAEVAAMVLGGVRAAGSG